MSRTALEQGVSAAMQAACETPMQWGVDDCALWSANIIRDALGYDPAATFRGRYKTRLGALRVLGPKGLLGAVRKAARKHGWQRIDPAHARPGDIGLTWTFIEVRGKQVATLATVVCRSFGWFVGRNEAGFTALKTDKVAAAWSVLDDMGPGPRVSFVSYKRQLVPTSTVVREPISIGFAILEFVGIVGASTAVAGFVGFVSLTALSAGLHITRGEVR